MLVHRYGPHIFHTNASASSSTCRASPSGAPTSTACSPSVDGHSCRSRSTGRRSTRLYGLDLDEAGVAAFLERVREPRARCDQRGRRAVGVGRDLCEKFFRGYTRKQWGTRPVRARAGVAARIPMRTNDDDRYFTDRFQAMPPTATRRCSSACSTIRRSRSKPASTIESATAHRCATYRLHRPDRRLLRPLLRQAAVPLARFEHEHLPDVDAVSAGCGTVNYPNDPRVHAHHRVQAPDRPAARRHVDRARISARRRRPVLSGAAPGQRGAVQALRGAGRRGDDVTSSAGSRSTATTTWTRSSARRWPPRRASSSACVASESRQQRHCHCPSREH